MSDDNNSAGPGVLDMIAVMAGGADPYFQRYIEVSQDRDRLAARVKELEAHVSKAESHIAATYKERDSWREMYTSAESQLAKVRTDRDTMLRVHDEMEAERDAARAECERLRSDRDSYARSDFERQLAEARADAERMRAVFDAAIAIKPEHLKFHVNGDWACAECRPHSDMLIDGFRCQQHALLNALSHATSGGKEQT